MWVRFLIGPGSFSSIDCFGRASITPKVRREKERVLLPATLGTHYRSREVFSLISVFLCFCMFFLGSVCQSVCQPFSNSGLAVWLSRFPLLAKSVDHAHHLPRSVCRAALMVLLSAAGLP